MCLLTSNEIVQDAGISQMGFLLGSCGVGLALTSEICLKGLPKTPTGEIMQFKGQKTTHSIAQRLILRYGCLVKLKILLLFSGRLATSKVGGDRLKIPDQAFQRLAATHPHRQH